MKLKEYKLGSITGKGRTITAARANAERQAIEAIEQLDAGPLLLSGPPGGCAAIMVAPMLGGSWSYAMLEIDQVRSCSWQASGYKTNLGAMRAAMLHAAQNVIDNVDTKTAFTKLDAIAEWAHVAFGDIGKAMTLRDELRDRLTWRVRYDAWRAAGAADNEAHHKATEGGFPPAKNPT